VAHPIVGWSCRSFVNYSELMPQYGRIYGDSEAAP